MRSDAGTLAAQGEWNGELDDAATRARTLVLTVSNLDRALLLDGWVMLAADAATPALLADIEQGVIVDGKLTLLPSRNADGNRVINWQRSSGTLTLAGLAISGDDLPAAVGGARHARILAWTYEAAARRRRIRSTRRDVRAPRLAAHWCAATTRRAAGRSRLAGVEPRTRRRRGSSVSAAQLLSRPMRVVKKRFASRICGASVRGSPTHRCLSVVNCLRSRNFRAPCVMPADSCAGLRSREAGSVGPSKSNLAARRPAIRPLPSVVSRTRVRCCGC